MSPALTSVESTCQNFTSLFLSGTITLETHPKDQPEYLSLSSHRWNSCMAWKQASLVEDGQGRDRNADVR